MKRAIEAEDDAAVILHYTSDFKVGKDRRVARESTLEEDAVISLEKCFAAKVVSLEEYFAAMGQRRWRNASRSQACRWRGASRSIVTLVQYNPARSIMDNNIAHTWSRKVKYEYESMGYECNYVLNGIKHAILFSEPIELPQGSI
ncbi:hypothetical protein PV325_000325, partial [Microctonus aethiopoides]